MYYASYAPNTAEHPTPTRIKFAGKGALVNTAAMIHPLGPRALPPEQFDMKALKETVTNPVRAQGKHRTTVPCPEIVGCDNS